VGIARFLLIITVEKGIFMYPGGVCFARIRGYIAYFDDKIAKNGVKRYWKSTRVGVILSYLKGENRRKFKIGYLWV
jgi:hypothetical protein